MTTLTEVRRYTLSPDKVVHRVHCKHQGAARPWGEVDGWSLRRVLARVKAAGPLGRACERCMFDSPDGSLQLALGDDPVKLRDEGMAAADAASPQAWRNAVDREIARRAGLGVPFTADDVTSVTGPSPIGSQGAVGSRFMAASRRRQIRKVDEVASKKPSIRYHHVAVWIGVVS